MKYSRLTVSVFCVFLFCCSLSFAGSYLDWQGEYDGSSSDTRALWSFNPEDLSEGNCLNKASSYSSSERAWPNEGVSYGYGGKFSNGAYFPGNGSYVSIYENARGIFPVGDDPNITVEMWIKVAQEADPQSDTVMMLADKKRFYDVSYQLQLTAGDGRDFYRLAFNIGDGSSTTTASSGDLYWDPNTFYHVAGVWDSSSDTLKVFRNGVELGAVVSPGTVLVDVGDGLSQPLQLVLGARSYNHDQNFKGMIDDVRISGAAYDFGDSLGHPRLFFGSDDVAGLAARRNTTHSYEWGKMISTCNNMQSSSPPSSPVGEYLLDYEHKFLTISLVQLLDPSQPYASTLENYFWTVLNWSEWQNLGQSGSGLDSDLELGQIIEGLAIAYDFYYDNFTVSERNTAEQKLIDIADDFRNWYHRFRDTTDDKQMWGNHTWNALCGLAAVMYGVDNIPGDIRADWGKMLDDKYAFYEDIMTDEAADGVNDEGATYAMFAQLRAQTLMELRRNSDDFGGLNPFTELDWFRNQPDYFMYISLPGGDDNFGGIARYGDCNPGFWYSPNVVLPLLANRLNDPVAQWLADEQQSGSGSQNIACRYMWRDPNIPAVNPSDLPDWKYFDTYGLFTWRESWADDSIYFTVKSGQNGHGHGDPDDGQFMIHRAGIPYITDCGYTTPRYTNEHNVLLVDGQGQVGDGSTWGDFGDWPDNNKNIWGEIKQTLVGGANDIDSEFFDVLCNPTPMYTNPKLNEWNREAIAIDDDLFLIRDTVSASNSANFELLFHSYVSSFLADKPFYDYESNRTANPFTTLSSNKWEIDPRDETPEPPNLILNDLSNDNWSSSVNQTWIYDHYDDVYERLGNHLSKTLNANSASSLMAFNFDDKYLFTDLNSWSDSSAEGVHAEVHDYRRISVLWPVDGISCTNSDGWDVTGKMAGRRYWTYSTAEKAGYFGREATYIDDNGQTLFSSNNPVSFYAKLEFAIPGNYNNAVITSTLPSEVSFYCTLNDIHSVLLDGYRLNHSVAGDMLTVSIPACEQSVLIVRTGNILDGDISGNGKVDFEDFALLAKDWDKTGKGLAGDIYESDKVDFQDLMLLASDWLK